MQSIRNNADFDSACNRAAEYANRRIQRRNEFRYSALEFAEQYLKRAGFGNLLFGIETVSCEDRELAYLNVGDTYSLTLAQEGDGEVFSTSWGDWLEATEQEHCEENGETRCGYCGEFTPVDSDDWHETVCAHCGRYVDSGALPPPPCQHCGERDCDCEDE